MKKDLKNRITFLVVGFVVMMTMFPLSANGTKDEEMMQPEQSKSVLQIVERPNIGFGEGGGIGAGQRPQGFEEIDPSIIGDAPNKSPKMVAAELTDLAGVLTVKGGKGNRKFTIKCDDGKTYNLKVPGEYAESLASLKNKKIVLQGVFYATEFLLFDMQVEKNQD